MTSLKLIMALFLAIASGQRTIYVSPEAENAGKEGEGVRTGSKHNPCTSVREALIVAEQYAADHKNRPIRIVLGDGDYQLTSPIHINGSAFSVPLTVCAAKGASPVLVGYKPTGEWTAVTDTVALRRIPDPRNVLQTDISKAGITDYGFASGDNNRFDFYCNGKRQRPAQWPNQGYACAGKVLGTTATRFSYMGEPHYAEPILRYNDPRIDSWADEPDAYLHGYWGFDWYDQYNPATIDKASKTMTIGGVRSTYGYRSGCHFRGIHLLCELDEPGEYWLDRNSGHLFWYAPDWFRANAGGQSSSSTFVSVFSGDYAFILNDCKNVTICGVTMCGLRGGAISITGGENVTVADCKLYDIANDAITVTGGHGHKISGCTLSELGCSGIILVGGNRDILEDARFEVSDCIVEDFALYRKTYRPCVRFCGCGMLIAHNIFRNGPSSALRLDGNEIKVEYNIFDNLVTESDDPGAIDIFNNYTFRGIEISNNYFKNIGDPNFHWAAGIRFDDRISGVWVRSNVFNHCGSSDFGAVQIHGGQDNRIWGNVFYDCPIAVSHSPWSIDRWVEGNRNTLELLGISPGLDSLTAMGKLYLKRYPELIDVMDTSLVNVNYFTGNLVVNSARLTNDDRFIVFKDNEIFEDDRDFQTWISPQVLGEKGITPIDLSQMGPR